ncbi:MAG: hypothetical protein WBC71_01405 [Salaquimonas sp.]
MNTPTHMIIGAAFFAKRDQTKSLIAAYAGGIAPDLPMLIMVTYATRIAGIPQKEVFETLFFSKAWQEVFSIDHSFFVWGVLLAIGLVLRNVPISAFAGSALAHAIVDFFTHHSDARQQFWPLTDWVFRSPVSYWDPAYFGTIMGPIEAMLVIGLAIIIVIRSSRLWERILTISIALVFLAPIAITGGFHGLHGLG